MIPFSRTFSRSRSISKRLSWCWIATEPASESASSRLDAYHRRSRFLSGISMTSNHRHPAASMPLLVAFRLFGTLFALVFCLLASPALAQSWEELPIEQSLRFNDIYFISPDTGWAVNGSRSEEHTSELQSRENLVCRLLLEK